MLQFKTPLYYTLIAVLMTGSAYAQQRPSFPAEPATPAPVEDAETDSVWGEEPEEEAPSAEAADASRPTAQDKAPSAEAADASQPIAQEKPPATASDTRPAPDRAETVAKNKNLNEMPALEQGQRVVNERAGSELSSSLYGFSGVFRTISARTTARNAMRIGTHTGIYYLTDGWDSANHTHLEARGHLVYGVLDDLEVRLDGIGTGHRVMPTNPDQEVEFIQTLGDVALGGKYAYQINEYLSTAGVLDFRFYTKLRSMGFRWGSFSMLPLAALTFDGREQPDLQWPLVAHMNLGFYLDNSSKVVTTLDGDALTFNASLTASRLTALNVRTGNQVLLNLGVEFPQEEYTVFLEYTTEQEVGSNKLARGVKKGHWNQSPQRFTPGVRWNFIDRVVMDAAVDLSYGLNGEYTVGRTLAAATTPYEFWLGLSYNYDPTSRKVVDSRGYVKGLVVDAETGEPLGGAIVQYPSGNVTRQLTNAEAGQFVSFPLLPGQAKIRIVREEYEPVVIAPQIISNEMITEKILMRRVDEGGQLVGALVGNVLDATAKGVSATLTFLDEEVAGTRTNPTDGSFVKILPPGKYKVQIEAEGYDTKVFLVPVEARRKTKVVFELAAVGGGKVAVGALAGTLLDPDGQPVGGTISFPEAKVNEVIANPDTGQFYATLPPGRYKIEVHAEGYGTRDYLIPIEAGKKTRVDIKLAGSKAVGAIAGRLLGPNNEPLAGMARFADETIGAVPVDPSTGGFTKILPAGTYDVVLTAPGYTPKKVKIQVLEKKKTIQDFVLGGESESNSLITVKQDSIELSRPISLAKGSTSLSADDKEILDAIADALAANTRELVIRAYTDDEGPAAANFRGTQAQAETVLNYLVSKGIDVSRLTAVGAGEEKPLAPNSAPENRAKNRRIEFQIK